jgi:hypothetical protein
MLRRAVWYTFTDVSEEGASTSETSVKYTRLDGATSQKTAIYNEQSLQSYDNGDIMIKMKFCSEEI